MDREYLRVFFIGLTPDPSLLRRGVDTLPLGDLVLRVNKLVKVRVKVKVDFGPIFYAVRCNGVCSALYKAMHRGALFFTVQRYNIPIAVHECFGNFFRGKFTGRYSVTV